MLHIKQRDEVEDRLPHITIASYNNLVVNKFINQLDDFYEDKSKVKLCFSSLATFLNSGALYLTPNMTRDLLDFHSQHHHFFQEFNDDTNTLYLPDKWIPHCTLANRLSKEKLSEAFTYCFTRMENIYSRIGEIALIETIYENNKCIKSPIIYSKRLK